MYHEYSDMQQTSTVWTDGCEGDLCQCTVCVGLLKNKKMKNKCLIYFLFCYTSFILLIIISHTVHDQNIEAFCLSTVLSWKVIMGAFTVCDMQGCRSKD